MKKLLFGFLVIMTSCVYEPFIEPEQEPEPFINIEFEQCDTFTFVLKI